MKQHIQFYILVLLLGSTIFAYSKETDPASSVAPYTITGTCKDSKGKPIAGAIVRIENEWNYFDVRTNAAGQYTSPRLPQASYKVLAWYTTTYSGQNYTLRLGMPSVNDYDYVDVTRGAVRNFVQKISGVIPDQQQDKDGRGYFGCTITFNNGTGSIYDEGRLKPGDYIAIMLTPTAALIDGSTGQKIERAFEIKPGNESQAVIDIPVGAYEVRAFVDRNGSWKPLLVGTFSSQTDKIRIEPKSSDYGIGTYQSGLSLVGLYLREPR